MFVAREAEKLGIGGFARNLFDGRVEILACGTRAQLGALRVALERGPRFSSVSGVREEEATADAKYKSRFVIEQNA